MSAEGATALYERILSDEEFRAQLEAAETTDDKRRFVTEAGYELTRDDMSTIRRLAGVRELSDEDLEKVAGGTATEEAFAGVAIVDAPIIAVAALYAAAVL